MKICYDAKELVNYGGIATYSRELIFALSKLYPNHSFSILTNNKDFNSIKNFFFLNNNIHLKNEILNIRFLGTFSKIINKIYNESLWKSQSTKYDLFHQTNQFFIHKKVKKFVATIHDLIPLDAKLNPNIKPNSYYEKKIRFIVENARLIYVPSFFVKNELEMIFPKSIGKVQVTHEAVSSVYRYVPLPAQVYKKYQLKNNLKYFLYVGRYEERKNLDRILRAYLSLPEDYKKEVSFLIIARLNEKEKSKFNEKIGKYIDGNQIIHINGVEHNELPFFYSSCFTFVFPTLAEGFGLPILEAMQCECPVITSNTTSMPEIAQDSALLVSPLSIDEIANAMKLIIDDEQLRIEMKNKAVARSKDFSWEKTAHQTFDGYLRAINS